MFQNFARAIAIALLVAVTFVAFGERAMAAQDAVGGAVPRYAVLSSLDEETQAVAARNAFDAPIS